ncbi:MAG: diaminopimelate epimerase [Planctomycetota bacterium]|nr:MAG: diaminopimelate epimerase [Planctomycetota bacterium]
MTRSHRLPFVKMHGIGNDYVYVNAFEHTVSDPALVAQLVADRQFGIGGDGLILIAPPTVEARALGATVRMRMFNLDGSEGGMCGNGIRCVTKFAIDRGLATANPLLVETKRGVLSIVWTCGEDGKVCDATVDMGAPMLECAKIPACIEGLSAAAHCVAHSIDLARFGTPNWFEHARVEPRMTLVSMGNPHVIFDCAQVSKIDLAAVGPNIERCAWFPDRINVHFVEWTSSNTCVMRTWERGSGITLACGTGATAVCVAGVLNGRARSITAQLPGGALLLSWPDDNGSVYMTGSATEVFEGEVDLALLERNRRRERI